MTSLSKDRKIQTIRNMAIVITFAFLLLSLFAASLLTKDESISAAERRPLASMPSLTAESVMNGSFFEDFEEYALDQFVFRDVFRSLKAMSAVGFLGKRDNNELYYYRGGLYKIEKENKEQVLIGAEKIESLAKHYTERGMQVYYSVIPDKNALVAETAGRPFTDVKNLEVRLQEQIGSAAFLEISSSLSAEDYYRTDLHWRQDGLLETAQILLSGMNSNYNAVQDTFSKKKIDGFYGAYYGQAALPVPSESLIYLTNECLQQVTLTDLSTGETLPLYDEAALASVDMYNFFVGGTRALLRLENPMCDNGKTLYLFRDSFGSSIAPLLVGGYSEIVLIDLRYVSSAYLDILIDFKEGCDVLFLYSTHILNTSAALR